jgi:acetyl/propionyl-CoA carboxylase alpha subunit
MTRITKLLIANRGEIASRIIRTARTLDIKTVTVFSEPDAQARFVEEADEAVALPGQTASETYLRGDLIIEAALRTSADAIHPGYGFLSENGDFAEACADAGIIFVGPPPAAIRSMGSKTAAKDLMRAAGVPTLAGITTNDDETPDGLSERALAEIGFPVLVKASLGGGGRGMRVVHDPHDLESAVVSARREAKSAFGDGAVFLERFVDRPRHIEVQIFADSHGQAIHLFERECSIQRRYQKIIEEAPSPVVDEGLRTELGAAAIAAAKAIGYVGAGTVEFILDSSGDFFFLEVNTRLQVEHPVTELITGSTWSSSKSRSPRGSRCRPQRSKRRSPATQSRPGCTPRTSPRATCLPPDPCCSSMCPSCPVSGSTPECGPVSRSASTTTRCSPKSSRTHRPDRRPRGCSPGHWRNRASWASSPTETCCWESSARTSSTAATSTPAT